MSFPLHKLPALGVGVTYSSAVEPLLRNHPELFDLVEIEPQTMWIETGDPQRPYKVSADMTAHLAGLPGRKLVHSIGVPVGGTVRPDPVQLALLRDAVDAFDSPWVSDHLSFNSTPEHATAFFLPPRQTASGVATVVRAISDLQAAFAVPVAVETGVNYLQPRPDDMPDGAFVAAVAEAADCAILLDLHNIFCNQLNGRQSIDDFLAQLPLERVIELHIAGGFEMDGFWLDAHSGVIPEHLVAIARRVIPALPNLKGITFEIFPAFIPVVGLDVVREQIELLHELWELRSTTPQPVIAPIVNVAPPGSDAYVEVAAWERALGALAIGRHSDLPLAQELRNDPGIAVVNNLICEFRASMIVTVLRLTARLMMLALGSDVLRIILQDFWNRFPPQQYAATEAENFARYLFEVELKVPQLLKVLEFERNVLRTLLDEQPRVTTFDFDPLPLFRALAEGRLPETPGKEGWYEIEVTADGPVSVTGLDLDAVRQVIPFH